MEACRLLFVVWAALGVPGHGLMDYGHFAGMTPDILPKFADPEIPPPSFIFAWPQFKPPYNLSTYSPEPFPGCNAEFASPCGIQQAIRMVTQAREEVCLDLDSGGGAAAAALANITAGAYVPRGTRKFGLVVLSADGTILADGLRADLLGQPFNGRAASHHVAQPLLLPYLDWVVRWGGGWVPHYTTRLEPEHTFQTFPAPVPAVAYFESCPGGHRLGVAVGRKPIPAETNCKVYANNLCAIQNINRILGRNLVDFLSTSSFHEIQDQHYRISFTEEYKVGTFFTFTHQLSRWGAPGPDPLYNPVPGVMNSDSTTWSYGGMSAYLLNGLNMSNLLVWANMSAAFGDRLHAQMARQAYLGGGWVTYMGFGEPTGGWHLKLSQVFGVIWNNTGWVIGAGIPHSPELAPAAPQCTQCSAAVSLPCSTVTCQRLAAHAQAEFLNPLSNWSIITYSRWFGALEPEGYGSHPVTWPLGFHVYAFDYEGNCVADGGRPDNVGLPAEDLIGQEAHERSMLTADNGGGWVAYTKPEGSARLAFTIKAAKAGQFYYLAVAFSPRRAAWEVPCSSRYSEPCSEQNAQVLVGAANADILRASSTSELLVVLEQIGRRIGAYAPAEAGDFQVHVYNSSWQCVEEAVAAGLPCPAHILSDSLPLLQAASLDEAGSWTDASRPRALLASASGPQRAFVFSTTFAELGSTERRKFFLLAAVSADYAPPRCSNSSGSDKAACPEGAKCQDGFCHCALGFRTDFMPNSSSCEELQPAEMTCSPVSGLDCAAAGSSSTCPPCGAGHFCPEGAALACPPGSFCPEGSSQPSPCPAGAFSVTVRARGPGACLPCQAGSFASTAGQTACTACPRGRATNVAGQSACELCEESTFQPEEGSTACHACEAVVKGATTALLGATLPEQCVCPLDTYMPLDKAECLACSQGLSCCEGSSLQNLGLPPGRMHRGCSLHPAPALLPGYWSDPLEPLVVFECASADHCPGGRPGSCGAHLVGRVCAHCGKGYYMTDKGCQECLVSDRSAFFFPVIPLVFVLLVPGMLYLRMKDPYLKWGSWSNVCTTVLFVTLNHYQMVDIVASTKVKVTSELETVYKSWAVTNNLLVVFKTGCTGIKDTGLLMGIKGSAPLLLGVAILMQLLTSRVVAWSCSKPGLRLNTDRLFNVYFAILFTFFGAISAMSLELFKCTRNPEPNPASSLLTDLSIVCFSSEEWTSMLALSIACVLLYVVFVGLVLVRTVLVAKVQFKDRAFRQRWAFLFLKYRLGCWWWGLVFLVKNFSVNISLVIFTSPVWQLYFIQFSIFGYMILVQKVHPYRSVLANRIELLSCFSVIFNASCMAAFAFSEVRAVEERRFGLAASAISFIPLALGSVAVVCVGFYGMQEQLGLPMGLAHQARQELALSQDAQDFLNSFNLMVRLTEKGCTELLRHLGEYERSLFREVDSVLCSELGGVGWGDTKVRKRKTQLSAGGLEALLKAKEMPYARYQADHCAQVGEDKVGGGVYASRSRWADKARQLDSV